MTDKDEPMRDIDDTEIDDRLQASREQFIAEHDAHHDFERSWADIVALAEEPRSLTVVADPMRRRGGRRLLAGAGSIAAAAAIVAAIVVAGDSDAEAELTPRIVAATRSALDDAIEHEVTDWEDTPQAIDGEAWRDQTTAAVRFRHYAGDGSGVSLDMGPARAPTPQDTGPVRFDELYVDHCFGEYTTTESPIPENAVDISASIAAGVASELDDGSLVIDGTEVVDGRELIRVVSADGSPAAVTYVDPDTYRPILVVDPEEGYRTTIDYLPRTPELLTAFTPTVPEGLHEVDELTRTTDHRSCS